MKYPNKGKFIQTEPCKFVHNLIDLMIDMLNSIVKKLKTLIMENSIFSGACA